MEFKSVVNKESFKAILHHHLKNQIQAKFGSSILKDIQRQSEVDPILSDGIVDSAGHNISQSDEGKEFLCTFLNSLEHLFEDKEHYIPKEGNQGTISQCSSVSSIGSSIDYISFDQFQDIIHTLTSGVNAEKLEALETFSRLPSLEHIIKKTLWPSIENGLHGALLSNVSLLKDASLQIYSKMLSSSEPKVVQESFNSLIKHILQSLLPTVNQNAIDFISKCKLVVEIIAMLNRFLQNIPNHWLRYPQPIIEDITTQSVSILSFGSCNPKIFPVWLCIALCDQKSKWFKTLLYGHVSRGFLINTLQKDSVIIKYLLEICEKFNSSDDCVLWGDNCCQKFAEVSEITHIICFLSYLLQYSESRVVFGAINVGDSISWLNVLSLIMRITQKLSSVSCLNCCSVAHDVVSKTWSSVWSCNNVCTYSDSLIKILLKLNESENLPFNSINFAIQCLCHSFYFINNMDFSQDISDTILDFICILYGHLMSISYNFLDEVPYEILKLLHSGLLLTNEILSNPSSLFLNVKFIKIFSTWCSKVSNVSKVLASSFGPGMKFSSAIEIEEIISSIFLSMLQRPASVLILQDLELFESSINILLENILQDIKTKNSACPRDIFLLSNVLNCDYLSRTVLNKSVVFKLSSIIWQLEAGELENLQKVRFILEILIPSIFPRLLEDEISSDIRCDDDMSLFHSLILYPNVMKEEFVMFEEYSLLALQIVSNVTCSILSTCCLQAKYKLAELLFDFQSHHYNEKEELIIDPVTVLQNHLLVKLYTIGGAEERVLPPETLLENAEDYKWPFFKNYQVPDVYYNELSVSDSVDMDITFELNGDNLKDIFLEYVGDDLLTVDVVAQMLKAGVNVLDPVPSLARTLNFVCLDEVVDIPLQDEIVCGIEMVERYGKTLSRMVTDDEKVLERLLKAGKHLLSAEKQSKLDIFISTLCLIFRCNIQTSWVFLETFAKSSSSLFIWYERIFQALEQNEKFPTTFDTIMEHCDIIVKKTLPLVYSALQFNGVLPSTLYKYWTTLCYWNYLNFTEIAHFVLVCVIYGGDYAIYFFIAVLKHLQSVILKNSHNSNLMNVIKQNAIKDYKIRNYINFIVELGDMFHGKISKNISDVLGY